MNTSDTKISKDSAQKYLKFRNDIFHSKSDLFIDKTKLGKIKKDNLDSVNNKEIKKIFDSLGFNSYQITQIPTKSVYHLIFKVKTEKGSYVIKIHTADKLFDQLSFYIEDKIQTLLSKKKLPYLEIVKISFSKSIVNFEYMIMKEAKGKNLEDLYPKVQDLVYRDLGKVFKKIHLIKTKKFGNFDVNELMEKKKLIGTQSAWSSYFLRNLQKQIDTCTKIKIIDKKQSNKIKEIFEENKNLLNLKNPSLLHNDPGFRNVFAKKDKITAILDWEDSISGDPDFELAFIYSFFFGNEDKFEIFLEGYGKKFESLEKSKIFWLYYLRIVIMKEVSNYLQDKKTSNSRILKASSHF